MPVVKYMPPNHLNNVIRMIKTASLDRVKEIKTATFLALKRLGVARQPDNARKKIPKGSDQVDVGSFITWLSKIQAEDTEAVKQIVIIDATACRRVEG
ncbi:hypothetical protein LCGC14_1724350 [marine sediment metagenome]|uniref:Uncharacterized protein n=1 Tax=marine sediment metagenome TaxID=412755 RepID=A0A0F9HZ98_9ZZZZ